MILLGTSLLLCKKPSVLTHFKGKPVRFHYHFSN